MSGKSNIDPFLKAETVKKYPAGEIGESEAARLAGIEREPFDRWINICKNDIPINSSNKNLTSDLSVTIIRERTVTRALKVTDSRQTVNGIRFTPMEYK